MGTTPETAEARLAYVRLTDGTLYRIASPVGLTQAAADLLYLHLTGGSLTGNLDLQAPTSTIRQITFSTVASPRWRIAKSATAESGSNLGSSLTISRYTDAGAYVDNPVEINRNDGVVVLAKPLWLTDTTPTTSNHAVSKSHLDGETQNLDWKSSVQAASTGNLTLSGTQTVDGVALSATARILVKDQTTTTENGIYTVAAGAWTRAIDADTSNKVQQMVVAIREGTTQAETIWMLSSNPPITLGTTPLTFVPVLTNGTADLRYLALAGGTMTGPLGTVASATGTAGLKVPHGTAPSSPVNGDMWTTTAGLFIRINGVTVGPLNVGATLLNGTVTPTSDDGVVGNYYLDTDAQILYGPKGSYGSQQYVYTTEAPNESVSFADFSFGADITITGPGRIVGLRFYRDASATASTRTMKLWSSSNVLLSTTATSAESGSGWKTATLSTPVDVPAGSTTVRVSFLTPTASPMVARISVGAGTITNGSLVRGQCYYVNGTGIPNATTSTDYLVDLIFEQGTPPWPVALHGPTTVVGGTKPTDPPVGTVWVPSGATVTARSYAQNIASGTTVVVTHNLATTDVVVAIYRLSDGLEVDVPFSRTSTNAITLNSAIDLAGHRVVILAAGG